MWDELVKRYEPSQFDAIVAAAGRRGYSLIQGPPGTGKTMASMIIAQTLGLDLFRVELSRIVSRYVGETEKNLARVFDEAEKGRVVLLFDEADALFTKRTQVKSSVDRYANLEVAYLLQRMENFEGISVLTTNAEQHLDDAFKRRIRYKIHFPFPDPETRGRLWSSVLPEQTPRHPDIPFALLGQYFELSGGVIKASALRAAFYAMQDGSPIGLTHLVRAATAECREAGALVRDTHPRPLAEALKREEVRG
ncbi:MAG: ATP-binding protein, partial [Myxococcota bacterium]